MRKALKKFGEKREAALNRRTVITLCGSTRFKKEFEQINAELTLQGNVVISVGVFVKDAEITITEQQKQDLDGIHFDKILLSDEIFVINKDGYIGESTRNEIEFAIANKKRVEFLEPVATSQNMNVINNDA